MPEANGQQWETITSQGTIRAIANKSDTVFFATSGGLLVVMDPSAPGQVYTNVDGLGTTDLTDIVVDGLGTLWITGRERLIHLQDGQFRQIRFFDNQMNPWRPISLADDGEFLWIGTEVGLDFFAKEQDAGEIVYSYDVFGTLASSPQVFDVLLTPDSIWIATSSGLAVANRTNPLLLNAPSSWTSFSKTDYPELGLDTVTRVAEYNGGMYIGTPSGFYRLERTPADTSFFQFSEFGDTAIFDLRVDNDSLFVYHEAGLSVLANDVITRLINPSGNFIPVTGYNTGQFRWVGLQRGEIFHNNTGGYTKYSFTGMPQNDVMDALVSADGELLVVYRRNGAALKTVAGWQQYVFAVGDRALSVIRDSSHYAYVGTFGNGLFRLDLNSPGLAQRFDTTGTTLRGNDEGPNYVVIFDLNTDGQTLLTACYRAFTDHPIAIASLPLGTEWDSLGVGQGLNDDRIVSIARYGNFIVSGTEANGVFICDVGGDLFNHSDDACLQRRESGANLRSDIVRVVRFTSTGELWVGTNLGISRFDPAIENRFSDVTLPPGFGPDITDIEFDARDNAYISSSTGLLYMNAVTGGMEVYTADNSGLISDDIRKVTVDGLTNDVYLSTSMGVSVFRTSRGTLTSSVSEVNAIPNPFEPARDGFVSFNFSLSGKLGVYTLAGELVYESRQFEWDGRNDAGEEVSSGVYLFTIESESGEVGRGKFLLIRR